MIAVALDADVGGRGTGFTLGHEIIHALHDARLWGGSTGLFKPAE